MSSNIKEKDVVEQYHRDCACPVCIHYKVDDAVESPEFCELGHSCPIDSGAYGDCDLCGQFVVPGEGPSCGDFASRPKNGGEDMKVPIIAKILKSLPFVAWDRYTEETVDGEVNIWTYGWIRKRRRDFVLIWFIDQEVALYWTSSVKYSKQIGKILFGDEWNSHNECRKIDLLMGSD